MQSVYLDYNATTPLDPKVREVMLPFLGDFFGNPSSIHHIGRKARSLLDDCRYRISQVWKCKPSEVVFTSGGTESNSLGICGTARLLKPKGRHLITSAIEHHAVLHAVEYLVNKEDFEMTILPVDADGVVSTQDLENAIRDDTILVSIMAANNETGAIQPVSELGAICQKHNVLFHTDAVQWIGKEPFESIHQFNADLVSICGHKFHAPKGVGALFIKSPLLPDPILFGGGHENERRAGTENLAGIAALVEAMEQFVTTPIFSRQNIQPLTDSLAVLTELDGVNLSSPISCKLANTISFTISGTDSMTLLAALDMEGICASSGSACSAGSLNPSHVISAMGRSDEDANSLVRFSLGRETKEEDITFVLNKFPEIIERVRTS